MYSLSQMRRVRGEAGEPIPSPFPGLEKMEAQFRRGEFSLVAAGPGTGKSVFALCLAIECKRPVLYFSADSNAATQLTRAGSMLTGIPSKKMKEKVRNDDLDDVESILSDRWWLRFDFDAQPSIEDVEMKVAAYSEVYGTDPHLIILDNITNIESDAGDAETFTFGLEALCDWANSMAKATGAHVLALHHVTGEFSDGLKPIPLSGIKGKIGRVPSMVLTIHKEVDDMGLITLHVSPVKNREGFSDPSGNTFVSYRFDTDRLALTELDSNTF
ncbi:hypothetical protein ADL27_32415 [Streptomyces sp. NRRL F-6602]|nr:hypothetical protein ADL27_32415 [Streptomyces sp. NRRL F-6602]